MGEPIRDERGAVIGEWRTNQDPSDPQRFHPVPKVNADSEPIVDDKTGEAVVQMLPLDDPRAVAQLETEGFRVEGSVLVAIEGHPVTDPAGEIVASATPAPEVTAEA